MNSVEDNYKNKILVNSGVSALSEAGPEMENKLGESECSELASQGSWHVSFCSSTMHSLKFEQYHLV